MISVVSPDTKEVTQVPAPEVDQYVRAGYVLDNPQLQAERAEAAQYAGAGNAAKAFGAAALRAPTLGLSDYGLEMAGVDKNMLAKLQEHQPEADALGTGAGLIGGALIPGIGEEEGAAAIAGKAIAAPMRATSAIGEGASGLTRKLLGGVFKDGSIVPGIAGGAADTAVQSAIYNAANQIDENHLAGGNLDQGIENALATTGDALKLGAGLHVLGAVGGHYALKGATSAIDGLQNFMRDKVIPSVTDAAAEGFAKASSAVTGEAIEHFDPYVGEAGAKGRADLLTASEAPEAKALSNKELAEQRDALAKELYEHLNSTVNSTKEIAYKGGKEGSVFSDVFPAEREHLLSGASSQKAVDEAQRLGEHLRQTADVLASDPVTYAPNVAKRAMQLSKDYDEKLAQTQYGALLGEKTTAPLELYKLIDETKSQITNRAKMGGIVSATENDAIGVMRQAAREFRSSLESHEVWGEQAARQASLNRAVSDHLTLLGKKGAFRKDFMMEVARKGGSTEWVVDRTKVNTFLNKLGAARGERQLDAMNQFLANADELVAQTRASGTSVGLDLSKDKYVQSLLETAQNNPSPLKAVGQTEGAVSGARQTVQQGISQQADQAKMRALANGPFVTGLDPAKQAAAGGLGSMGGATLGAALGPVGLGGAGVVAGVRKLALVASNPIQGLTTLAKIERFNQTTSRKIQAGLGSFMKKAGDAVERVTEASRPAVAEEVAKVSYAKQLAKMAKDNADKQTQSAQYQAAIHGDDKDPSPVAQHAPNFAQGVANKQTAIAQYLWSQFPKDPSTMVGVGGGKFSMWAPSSSEMRAFQAKADIATHPLRALEKLQAGTLSAGDVEVLGKLWPQVLQQARDAALTRISTVKHDLTIAQKRQLSILVGQPIAETQTPQMVQLVTQAYDAQEQQKKAAQAQGAKGLDTMATSFQTAGQKLASK